MFYYWLAVQDLYQEDSPAPASSAPEQTAQRSGSWLDLSFVSDQNWSAILTEVNSWFLAFTVFYSFLFFVDFLFWAVIYPEGSVANEERGHSSLDALIKMWASYGVFLIVWQVSRFWSDWAEVAAQVVSFVVLLLALFMIDLPRIPVFKNIFGQEKYSLQALFSSLLGLITGLFSSLLGLTGSDSGSSASAGEKDDKKKGTAK